MKKLLSVLLCLVLAAGLLPLAAAPAHAMSEGDFEYEEIEPYNAGTGTKGKARITKYNGSSVYLDIPTYVGSGMLAVTEIGNGAFKGNTNIVYVSFGENSFLTSIGDYAFNGCQSMNQITLPETVSEIGKGAFQSCDALTTAEIPGDIDYLEDYLFYGCSDLMNVSLPSSLETIGANTFYGCNALEMVYFAGSKEKWDNVSIGFNNDAIVSAMIRYSAGEYVASGYCGTDLRSVGWALRNNGLLTVSGAGDIADYNPTDPINAVSAPWYVFKSSVTRIEIGSGVVTVGAWAFYDLNRVTSVTIPASVLWIREYAFDGCDSITDVYYVGSSEWWIDVDYYYGNEPLLEADFHFAPDAPAGLIGGNNKTTGRVTLSWELVDGATGYNVYRSTSEHGTYTKLNDAPVTALSYTDGKSGAAGTTYWYTVAAVNDVGEGPQSMPTECVAKCQKPANLKATPNNAAGTVKLTWNAPMVAGSVSYYRIYKYNASSSSYEWIGGSLKAAGTATSFTIPAKYVTPGTTVKYSIRGYNTKNIIGSLSEYADPASAKVTPTAPAAPTNLAAGNNLTTGRIKLSWKASTGATGYNIYRSMTETGTYEKLNTTPVTDLTYTDGRSGNAGNTYWYKVTAVNSVGESAKTAAISRIAKCQRPTGLKATANTDGSVTLKWDAPLVKGSVSYYRVYLWNTSKSAFEWINGSLKAAGTATTVKIPASYLTAYKGKSVQFSLRGYNTKNVLETISIYAVPASATVK